MISYPNHIYLDLAVINNNYKQSDQPAYLRFEGIRNTPFLEGDNSEYLFSIVTFTIQTGKALPLFIPRVVLGQEDTNKTIYTDFKSILTNNLNM